MVCTYFRKYQKDAERNCMLKMFSNSVLNSHLDLTDEKTMSNMCVDIFCIFGIPGTVPTYLTAYVPTYNSCCSS